MRKIILASSSIRRKEILEKIGLDFEVHPSSYEEDMSHTKDPRELAEFLSIQKAKNLVCKFRDDDVIIIGADTLISCDGEIYGKPHTPERAKEMLQAMSGRSHEVITGYALIETRTMKIISGAESTRVFFKKLNEAEIDRYIATGEPLDRAGAYAIQEKGEFLVDKIEGDYDNIIGLPSARIIESLNMIN